jgi:hypothetical protein
MRAIAATRGGVERAGVLSAGVAIIAEQAAPARAGTGQVAVREVRLERGCRDGDRLVVARVSRRQMTDLHLRSRSGSGNDDCAQRDESVHIDLRQRNKQYVSK